MVAGDPMADPRAADLLAARPDEVAAAAARLRVAADESALIAAGLVAAGRDPVWRGSAADAFRRAAGRLPPRLGRLEWQLGAVVAALLAYEAELARIRWLFAALVVQLEQAGWGLRGWSVMDREAELDGVRRTAFALLDEFDDARWECEARIAAEATVE